MLTITDSTIADNTAAVTGGGLELEMTGTMSIISNTTIAGNRVLNNGQNGFGGGINVAAALPGDLILINDTINGNFADNGGGVFWTGRDGLPSGPKHDHRPEQREPQRAGRLGRRGTSPTRAATSSASHQPATPASPP